MKKIILMLLVCCMLVGMFTGCTPAATTTGESSDTTGTTAEQSYTLTFSYNTGEFEDRIIEVAAGTPITQEDPTLSRYGYSFSGWFLEADAKTALAAEQVADKDLTLYAGWTEWDAATKTSMDLFITESDLAKYITMRPKAFESTGFLNYMIAYNVAWAVTKGGSAITDKNIKILNDLKAAREALVQIANPEDQCWYIWGESMPTETAIKEGTRDFYNTFDNEDFKPFLIPYMIEDQTAVKGNIIVVAGGGFFERSNINEGYPVAEAFQKIGYNCFVLQRRVFPYDPLDCGLDLQRSIRYIRANAEALGIARTDIVAVAGFSGGGGTILKALNFAYGDITPDKYYADYTPDAVDSQNSDMQVALMIYGAWPADYVDNFGVNPDNANFPKSFIVTCEKDYPMIMSGSMALYSYLLEQDISAELHIFANAQHGFGTGQGIPGYLQHFVGADQWIGLADTFMQVSFGFVKPVTID